MLKLKIFALLVLGSCGVVFASGEQVTSEEVTIKSDVDEVTLSTELRPPPLLAAGEHHGIVHLINLFAVKEKIDENSKDKSENSLKSESSKVIGPLASLLLIVDDDDEGGPLDDLTKLVVEADYEAKDTDSVKDLEEVGVGPIYTETSKAEIEKPKKLKNIRSKRTLFRKHKMCGSCGGYGGNYGYYGGGGYPNGGAGQPGYSILVVPVTVSEGGGGGGNYHGGGYQGGHTGGGGGQIRPYPSPGYYPGGSGNQWGGGGGGGGNAYAEAHASADAIAYGR